MIVQLSSMVFFLFVLTLTILDARRLKSIITPFTVTSWPFVVISLVTNFFLDELKFPPMTMRAHLFVLSNLLIIWMVGFIISYFKNFRNDVQTITDIRIAFRPIVRYQYFLMVFSLILSIVIYYLVYSVINQFGGWWFFGDERFEEMMITGPVAHLIQLARVCFLLLLFIYPHSRRKFFIAITLGALFIAVALVQVKYHLIWLIIIGFLYLNIHKKLAGQLKGVAAISLLVFLMMNLLWISLTFAWGTFSLENEAIRDYLVNNSISYFVSGPILLDRWLDWPSIKPDWVLLIVIKNISNFIMGIPQKIELVPLISNGFLQTAPGIMSNVGTSFGLYYMIGGYPFTLFMTTLIATLSYYFYFQSIRRKTPIWVYLNLIFLTVGTLSFYGQYFTVLSIYEMTAMFIVFILIFRLLNAVAVKN